jgi:hypothetical protein
MQKRKINIHWVIIVAGFTALMISYSLLWMKMINNPVENTGSDFITYYTAGVIANRYGLENVYDFQLQKAIEEEIVGFEIADSNVMPHNHIPLINPILALLVGAVGERYLLDMSIWALVLLLVYIPTVRVLLRIRSDLVDANFVNNLAFLLFFPLFVSLLNGQDTVLLVLGAVLLLRGVLNRQDWTAGLGLALMIVRPQIALMMALPFIFTHRRIWWRFCAIALLFVLISIIPLGVSGVKDFLNIMFNVAVGSRNTAFFNIIGLLSRAFPDWQSRTIQLIGWGAYVLGVIGLLIAWRQPKEIDARVLGLALVLSLLVSPHLLYHDLTLLMIPLVIAIWKGTEGGLLRKKDAAVVVLVLSVFLLLSFVWTATQYMAVYLLMGILLGYLWKPGWVNGILQTKLVLRESHDKR